MSGVQQETDGHERTGTDQVSQMQGPG
jgi:hypothetical protein